LVDTLSRFEKQLANTGRFSQSNYAIPGNLSANTKKNKNSKEYSADIYSLLNPFVIAKVFMSSDEELINSVQK
jgi:hypothetical protein